MHLLLRQLRWRTFRPRCTVEVAGPTSTRSVKTVRSNLVIYDPMTSLKRDTDVPYSYTSKRCYNFASHPLTYLSNPIIQNTQNPTHQHVRRPTNRYLPQGQGPRAGHDLRLDQGRGQVSADVCCRVRATFGGSTRGFQTGGREDMAWKSAAGGSVSDLTTAGTSSNPL